MRKLLVLCTLVGSLVLGPVAAGATAAQTTRPFASFVLGHVVPGSSDVSGVALSTATGFGPVFVLATGVPFNNGTVIVFTTHTTFTAPNGDTLLADGAIVEVPSNTPQCQGNLIGGAAVFVGGTGRFVGATGSVQTTGCIHRDVDPPRVNAVVVGSITS
jgi:hypothetical protein